MHLLHTSGDILVHRAVGFADAAAASPGTIEPCQGAPLWVAAMRELSQYWRDVGGDVGVPLTPMNEV